MIQISMFIKDIKTAAFLPYSILLIVLIIAVVFRFPFLESTPPGLYPDEAIEGNNALHALETGHYSVFYPENNGREGLYVNLIALSFRVFGVHIWSLRLVSAVAGFLTVLGLYFLTKRLFNWQVAALASYFLAISFWHVNFSRIGFRAILLPLILAWGWYFLWRSLETRKWYDIIIAGLLLGLGWYTYIPFRVMPLIFAIAAATYLIKIKKELLPMAYVKARNAIVFGLGMIIVIMGAVAAPLVWYFWQYPADAYVRTSQVLIFNFGHPVLRLIHNIVATAAMFNIAGDANWRHNLAGNPQLILPVGILFAAGTFFATKKIWAGIVGNLPLPPKEVMLLSWFCIGLVPTVLSVEGIPHALRSITVILPAMIFAAIGLWEIKERVLTFYDKPLFINVCIIIFLAIVGIAEYHTYFTVWAKNPNTAAAFNQPYVQLGNRLAAMPAEEKKYVLVNAGGELVNGIAMPAQTVMFITDTWTKEKQDAKHLHYLSYEDFCAGNYDKAIPVFPLEAEDVSCQP